MGNTYTQIHIQVVFTVQNRKCIISSKWKDELYKYSTGIIQNYDHKVLAINGMPDHLHIFIGFRPTQSISDLMRILKSETSKWINNNGFVKGRFSWQEGYGAFSYSKSHVNSVIDYIKTQEEHHRKKAFIEEYRDFLEKFNIPFDERYIFKPIKY